MGEQVPSPACRCCHGVRGTSPKWRMAGAGRCHGRLERSTGRSTQGPRSAGGGKDHQEEPSLLFAPVAAAEHHRGTCQDLRFPVLLEPGLFSVQMGCLS